MTVEIRQLIRQMSGANPLWGAVPVGKLIRLAVDRESGDAVVQ
jgi:hypothetical protein